MSSATFHDPITSLPSSLALGVQLTGSGAVNRTLLTFDDLMNGVSNAPVDDSAFALPPDAAMSSHSFMGRLVLFGEAENGGFHQLRDDLYYSGHRECLHIPKFDFEFVQDGSHLIPVSQGLIISGHPYWNYIIGPGRIWLENGDHGYSRASFPFALVERNANAVHNGVMTFLFNGMEVSNIRYQITKETCVYFKFDMWGQLAAKYTPENIPAAAILKAAHTAEVANRLPTRPLSALAADFPDSGVELSAFGSGITPAHMTAYGLVINGINYISGGKTRHGQYPYCESMRLPSYSTAKSAFASLALMRLGQKYGRGIYDLLIKDFVPEAAKGPGDWSAVTFKNTIDMATGHYNLPDYEGDEGGLLPTMNAFLNAETYAEKIETAFSFPHRIQPGRLWVYHTSDSFILTCAMNNYLIQQEGGNADIFNMVRDEVYIPLHLSAGALTSLRTGNSSTGAPFGGYGLFWTPDDIAKIALLLNNQNGKINGVQVLNPDMLADAMQKNPNDRGLDTTGIPIFKYNKSFWAKGWQTSDSPDSFWTPFMSGYGGITVAMMPNGPIYYYFSDNEEFVWAYAMEEANKLMPIPPSHLS